MKLRWWLLKNNLTDKDFAEKLMLSRTYLSEVKNGNKKPTVKTATMISNATNGEVTVDEIINPENFEDPY